ncbi:MAG: elongation factor G [Prevotellaceae bacterium]|jgi:elongation factor G|nr:elongation factor G [Prevotellaceae bacterium]
MKTYPTEKIRNIVLLGAPSSGKTTLAEAMLFEGKVIDRRGSVEAKNTASDNTELEQTYQRSIYSTVLAAEFMERKLNFIDTPGSDDFSGGVFSAFKVCDTGVMLVNAQSGMEVGTEIFARYADQHHKPLIVAINQLDSEKADYEASVASLREAFGKRVVQVQYPLATGAGFDGFVDVLKMKMYKFKGDTGQREELEIPGGAEMERAVALNQVLVEAAAEYDETLMELFFEKGTLDDEEIRRGLRTGMKNRDVMPVFCLSAKKDIGVKRLMEFIINVAPSPEKARVYKTVDEEVVPCDPAAAPSLFIFKTAAEQHVGELCYFRVMSGKIAEGTDLVNANNDSKERITQLFAPAGKNRMKVAEMEAGDIGCTVKLKSSHVNHTLNGGGKTWKLYPITFPQPKFRTAIKPKNLAEEEKLGEALNRMRQEDPTILVEYSKELKQTIVSGQGEHHINILKRNLSSLYKIEVDLINPKIPYRETITKVAAADYRHKKQSGGAGQFGEVHLVIEPHEEGAPDPKTFKVDGREITLNVRGKDEYALDWGGKLVFYNCIVGGAVDARFLPAILKGIMEKMEDGPLTGSYARDIRVAVYDGKMHPVDSNEISFKLAGRNAFKDAFRKACPKIMEPIYAVEVLVPADCMGDVMSDLQNRRGIIEGMGSEKNFEQVKARVPLAEMNKYSTTLSSLTSGRATYTMSFIEYQQVPPDVQEKLLKEHVETDKDE